MNAAPKQVQGTVELQRWEDTDAASSSASGRVARQQLSPCIEIWVFPYCCLRLIKPVYRAPSHSRVALPRVPAGSHGALGVSLQGEAAFGHAGEPQTRRPLALGTRASASRLSAGCRSHKVSLKTTRAGDPAGSRTRLPGPWATPGQGRRAAPGTWRPGPTRAFPWAPRPRRLFPDRSPLPASFRGSGIPRSPADAPPPTCFPKFLWRGTGKAPFAGGSAAHRPRPPAALALTPTLAPRRPRPVPHARPWTPAAVPSRRAGPSPAWAPGGERGAPRRTQAVRHRRERTPAAGAAARGSPRAWPALRLTGACAKTGSPYGPERPRLSVVAWRSSFAFPRVRAKRRRGEVRPDPRNSRPLRVLLGSGGAQAAARQVAALGEATDFLLFSTLRCHPERSAVGLAVTTLRE
nr:translation initiation factor IF-2 [Oryctolagus cuniculus]